jgi:hypothetical protein
VPVTTHGVPVSEGELRERVDALLAAPRATYALNFGLTPLGEIGSSLYGPPPPRRPVILEGTRLSACLDDRLALLGLVFEAVAGWQWNGWAREHGARVRRASVHLRPAALALAAAPAAQWWWKRLDRSNQVWLDVWANGRGPLPFEPSLEDGLSDITAPDNAFVTSTQVLGVPLEAFWDWDGVATPPIPQWRLPVLESARVYEVHAAEDWVSLVTRYPRDTSRVRRRLWRANWGTPDRPVITPDWRRLAEDYDAVHLSMAGLLTAAGRPLDVSGGFTMLEGWETESTVWLRPAFGTPERVGDWLGPIPYHG